MERESRIYVAGHTGMVGSAIKRTLLANGYNNIITRTHSELDLTSQWDVEQFFAKEKPEFVFMAAAKVGGIHANSVCPATFYYENITMQNNVIHYSYVNGINKLLFLGSTCMYPVDALQPIKETSLMSGHPEKTNEAYAVAKLAGVKMCQFYRRQYGANFISCIPANAYGKNDNYDSNGSHVIPALIKKFHDAKINSKEYVEVWGTGTPKREFLHVNDLADAVLYVMQNYENEEPINIGTGEEISIRDLAKLVKSVVGSDAEIKFDVSKPDGAERRLCDVSKLVELGWKSKIKLKTGIEEIYDDYISREE